MILYDAVKNNEPGKKEMVVDFIWQGTAVSSGAVPQFVIFHVLNELPRVFYLCQQHFSNADLVSLFPLLPPPLVFVDESGMQPPPVIMRGKRSEVFGPVGLILHCFFIRPPAVENDLGPREAPKEPSRLVGRHLGRGRLDHPPDEIFAGHVLGLAVSNAHGGC